VSIEPLQINFSSEDGYSPKRLSINTVSSSHVGTIKVEVCENPKWIEVYGLPVELRRGEKKEIAVWCDAAKIEESDKVEGAIILHVSGNAPQGFNLPPIHVSYRHLVPATLYIALPSTHHDFGRVRMGRSSAPWLLEILNNGTSELHITSVSVITAGAPFAVQPLTADMMVVPPRTPAGPRCVQVGIEFRPTARGSFTGTVEVRSNDPKSPAFPISVSGQGIAPEIQVSWPGQPGALDFGQVEIGQAPPIQKIQITNRGDDVLGQIVITSSASGEFMVRAYRQTLPPGDQQQVDIAFQPQSPGTIIGQLRIESDDPMPGKSLVFVPLRGEGYKRPITVTPSRWEAGTFLPLTVEGPDPLPEKIHIECEGATFYMVKKLSPKIFSAVANVEIGTAKKIYPLLISNGETGEKIGSVEIEVI
jgi:hypothetical protein